jgi:hypothetical protein
MKNVIAYLDLLGRRYSDKYDDDVDLSDALDYVWRALTDNEREVANHAAKVMSRLTGDEE